MKMLELPDSKLQVCHRLRHRTYGKGKNLRRGTEVALLVVANAHEGVDVLLAHAICHPCDNFNKRVGRKQAASALLSKTRGLLKSKRDRALLFNAICPEYGLSVKYRPEPWNAGREDIVPRKVAR